MNDVPIRSLRLGDPQLLNAKQLASWLGVSLRTVRRMDAERQLPAPVTIGRLVRWYQPEILNWLETKRRVTKTVGAIPDPP